MNTLKPIITMFIICCFSLAFSGEPIKNSKKIIGIYENIMLIPDNTVLPAKLDTGADMSSIHGENVEVFEKDGKKYVRFLFVWDKNGLEEKLKLEKPLVKYIKVKRKGDLPPDRRPVINLEFCLDGVKYKSEFSIADRDNFKYPLLLGRRFLRKHFIIDPDKDYITNVNACDKYLKDEN